MWLTSLCDLLMFLPEWRNHALSIADLGVLPSVVEPDVGKLPASIAGGSATRLTMPAGGDVENLDLGPRRKIEATIAAMPLEGGVRPKTDARFRRSNKNEKPSLSL